MSYVLDWCRCTEISAIGGSERLFETPDTDKIPLCDVSITWEEIRKVLPVNPWLVCGDLNFDANGDGGRSCGDLAGTRLGLI